MIRNVQPADAVAIAEIYNYYVQNTIVTFEEKPITPDEMATRIQGIIPIYPWIVYQLDGRIVGYSYAGRFHSRCAYRNTVETTVYVHKDFPGKGIGSQLYETLLSRLKQQNLHTALGLLAIPNPSSEKLHQKFGFEKVAHLKEVGFKFGNWIDVGYWQIMLCKE